MPDFFLNLYIRNRFILAIVLNALVFITGFIYPLFYGIGKIMFIGIMALFLVDNLMLFLQKKGLYAQRQVTEKISNGDENLIVLKVGNNYRFPIDTEIIDEIPHQFQRRDVFFQTRLKADEQKKLNYYLRPTERGEYHFGKINLYAIGIIGFISRRYRIPAEKTVAVYPSFVQLQQYEFMAISNRLTEIGIKKLRKVGHNMEFDQIREYVAGDDIRSINWKATARRNSMMVNQYQDEKSQNVYCVIDKGRTMKMPFNEMTLLDYAINASLVLSSVALRKDDKAGLITFSNKMGTVLKSDKRRVQMMHIQEALYKQTTRFKESDMSRLYRNVKWNVRNRSLMLLFTNFESLVAMRRQLPYFRSLSKDHMLVVIFFQNTELNEIIHNEVEDKEQLYVKTMAEKFYLEKKQIVKELMKYGIHSVLTPPENLTVNTINKYLEVKARGLI